MGKFIKEVILIEIEIDSCRSCEHRAFNWNDSWCGKNSSRRDTFTNSADRRKFTPTIDDIYFTKCDDYKKGSN